MCLNNLNDEYRCDFLVNKSRKKLWKIELEMLVWVNKICDDNNLNYFLLGGSAIGAIRHKGFIPWDDDLDIGMFRSDFNKFIEIINNLDGFPYFIQYGQNDNGKISSLLRIRDSSSTGILREDFNRNCNNGIFIEIYPFDNVPDNYLARKLQFTLSYVLYHGMHAYYYGSSSVKQFFGKILVIIIGYERTYDIWQKNNQKFNNLDCQYVDTVSLPYYYRKGIHRFKKEWINNYCKVPFE